MLTDDDLVEQLGGAMRSATEDLTWTGEVPRARRTPSGAWLTVPALAAVGAVGVAVTLHQPADAPVATPTHSATPSGPTAVPPASPAAPSETALTVLTDEIELVGFRLTVPRGTGGTVLTSTDAVLPAGAQPVQLEEGASGRAWVGRDAKGRAGFWITSPIRGNGRFIEVVSAAWTLDQARAIVLGAQPLDHSQLATAS